MASEGDARPPAVVGVDGSDQSVAALRWAVRYGAATGTPVRAVLAWHYPTAAGQPPVGHAPEPVTKEVEGHEVTGLLSMRDIVRCWSETGTPQQSEPTAART